MNVCEGLSKNRKSRAERGLLVNFLLDNSLPLLT